MTTRFVPAIYERYWRPPWRGSSKGVTGPGMAEEVRIARLLLGLGPGDTVLDVACGPGNFSREFAQAVGEDGLVVGIDASRTMLDRGVADLRSSGLANLALIRGDATGSRFATRPSTAPAASRRCTSSPTRSAALDEMRGC